MNRNEENTKVFSLDGATGGIIAEIQDIDIARLFNCTLDCCKNPVCTCGKLDITFFNRANGETDKATVPHCVSIDVIDQKLDHAEKKYVSEENEAFARMLLADMNNADFQFLWQHYFIFKNKITENSPPAMIDAVFDFAEVERDGLMYAYQDILPYGDLLKVTITGENYYIYDHYCLLPKCSCADTNLAFLPTEETNIKDKELFSVALNYKKRKWEAVESGGSLPGIESLRSIIEAQIPDIYQRMLKRHRKVKEIYAHCKKKHFKQQYQSTSFGRNDPCPCGSGRKYKKCCLSTS